MSTMTPEQTPPSVTGPAPVSPATIPAKHSPRTALLLAGLALVVAASLGVIVYVVMHPAKQTAVTPVASQVASPAASPASPAATPTPTAVSGVVLDPAKSYGDKYANGLLPVGDNKYVTAGAKKGSVYLCQANFVPSGQAGAQKRGPWFVNNNTQWDMNKKSAIAGTIAWKQNLAVNLQATKRVIATNDLPDHHTGVFPVAKTDPARVYDANPNTISAQTLEYNLAATPTKGDPQCMGGEVGVMLTGVALFNGFDAGGRDAGAWEVQDTCDGHPQNKGEYHYHSLSRCITDTSVTKVIGFALDGFPITGPKVGTGNILTTDDLDECHGLTSEVTLDGKKTTTYHYVMTQDFPYSASCFRSTAIKAPGLPEHP